MMDFTVFKKPLSKIKNFKEVLDDVKKGVENYSEKLAEQFSKEQPLLETGSAAYLEEDLDNFQTVAAIEAANFEHEKAGKGQAVLTTGKESSKAIENQTEVEQPDDKLERISHFIELAFEQKGRGDIEGAIINYLYALEMQPDNDTSWWIIIDTCALYKQLGQAELAREILQGYIDEFDHIINDEVRREIELNLE